MAAADNSRALGSRCSDSSELQHSRRIALQRPVAFGTPDLPCFPLPKLHPTSITINNIK